MDEETKEPQRLSNAEFERAVALFKNPPSYSPQKEFVAALISHAVWSYAYLYDLEGDLKHLKREVSRQLIEYNEFDDKWHARESAWQEALGQQVLENARLRAKLNAWMDEKPFDEK